MEKDVMKNFEIQKQKKETGSELVFSLKNAESEITVSLNRDNWTCLISSKGSVILSNEQTQDLQIALNKCTGLI